MNALFLDLDGTLVDNEHLKAHAFAGAIEQFGGQSHPTLYQDVMGMSGPAIVQHFISQAGLQIEPNAYAEAYKARYTQLLHTDLAIRPSAREFLQYAQAHGLRLALVSGAGSTFVNYIVDTLQLAHFFDFVIASEDVANKKPAPDCYQLALTKMGVKPEQAIVFEDTQAGLQAAHSAGIATIAIRHTYNHAHDLSQAIAEFTSFEDNFVRLGHTINTVFDKIIFTNPPD